MVDLAGEEAGEAVVEGSEGVEGFVGTDGREEAGVGEGIFGKARGGGGTAMVSAVLGLGEGKGVSAGTVGVEVEGVDELAKEEGEGGVFDVRRRGGLWEEALGDGVEAVEGGEGVLNWGG